MPTLTIRNLPEDVHAALRVRAAKAGRSMEEEARRAIAEMVSPSARAAVADSPKPFDRNEAIAAAAELRRLVMVANGGRMPDDSVDRFIAEKRADVAAEEAKFAASLTRRAEQAAP